MIVAAKFIVAPLLLMLSAFAMRRWGGSVGGVLLGLPVVSGPTSALMLAEHGDAFARTAARTALLGLVATAVFCLCYWVLAEREGWRSSLIAGYSGCLGSVWLFSHSRVGFGSAVLFAVGALALIARLVDLRQAEEPPRPVRARELAIRMGLATGSVWLVTAAGGLLGPSVAGLLAPLPVLAAVITVRTHRHGEGPTARDFLRGTVLGSWGGAGFFTVVGLMAGAASPVLVYSLAVTAAIATTLGALVVSRLAGRAAETVAAIKLDRRPAHRGAGNDSIAAAGVVPMRMVR